MCDTCNDNRFELIKKYKQKLLDATNIEDSPEEMAVIDNILFRFWQMGWLEKLELFGNSEQLGRLIDEQTAYDVLTDYYHHTTDIQHEALREVLGRVETVDAVPVEDVFELAIALSKGIEVLELPARVYNALSRSAYYTVADVYVLWKSGNLKKLWNLGDKSIRAVEDRLCEYLRRWRTEEREGER